MAIQVNLGSGANTVTGNWNYSNTPTTIGTLVADLIDDTGAATGRTLTLDSAFTGASGTDATATSGAGGLPQEFFDYYWYDSADTAEISISATNGEAYTLTISGHQGSLAARNTDFFASGGPAGATEYNNSGTATPTAPVTINGTVSGTSVTIRQDLQSSFAYINGFTIEFTAGTSVSAITDPVTDASTGNTFSVSGFGSDITSITLKDDVATTHTASGTIQSGTGDGPYTWDMPNITSYGTDTLGTPFDSAYWGHTAEVTDGTDTGAITIVVNEKSGWNSVDVSATPNTASGSVFFGWTGTPAQYDQVYYPTANNTSVDADGILTTDQLTGSITMVYFDQSDSKWKPFSIIISVLSGSIGLGRVIKRRRR